MKLSVSLFMTSTLAIAASFVKAGSKDSTNYYPSTTIASQDDFCLFLPPQPGLEVAINEDNGIPFCFKEDRVKDAKQFPEGFITTAHYLKKSNYVQVTGFFDHTKYNLSDTDGGGQYDTHHGGKPIGAKCLGYNYFVSIIEPDINRFCIRCCQDTADCNTGRSGYGCLRVVEGDYTENNNMIDGTSSSDSTLSNTHENSVFHELEYLVSHKNAASLEESGKENDSSSDVNADITREIEYLKSNAYSANEIKQKWNDFAKQLSSSYPRVSDQIEDLNIIASSLITTEQWNAFFELVSDKIIYFQETSSPTAEATPSSTDTHTNEDLEWLFNHRNSHDNQATW